jgi:hypothetical protein
MSCINIYCLSLRTRLWALLVAKLTAHTSLNQLAPILLITLKMSSTSTDLAPNAELPKIVDDGENNNYAEWKTRSQCKLRSWGLWKYIEGLDSMLPNVPILRETYVQRGKDKHGTLQDYTVDGNSEEYHKKVAEAKPWVTGDKLVLDKIISATPSNILPLVQNIPHAKQAWEALHSTYQPTNSIHAATVRADIITYQCTLDMDISYWLKDMQHQFHILRDMDPGQMTNHDFVLIILNNMPQDESWQSLVTGLRAKLKDCDDHKPPLPIISLDYLTAIREESWYRNRNNPQLSAHVFTACAEAERRGSKCSRMSDASTSGSAKRPRVSNDRMCTNMHCAFQKGHTFLECIAYMGGSQGKYPHWWRGPWNVHLLPEQHNKANNVPPSSHPAFTRLPTTSPPKPASYSMHKTGQTQLDPSICYIQDALQSLSHADTSASITTEDNKPTIQAVLCNKSPGHAWINCLDNEFLVVTKPVLEASLPRSDTCYHDTGANRHVFHDKTVFETYESLDPMAVSSFGKGITIPAFGHGTVRIEGHYGDCKCMMILKNVLHIPAAHCNLISGVQLDKISVSFAAGDGLISLSFRKKCIVGGALDGDMYCLNMRIIQPHQLASQIGQQPLIAHISPIAATASSDQQGFYTALWGT